MVYIMKYVYIIHNSLIFFVILYVYSFTNLYFKSILFENLNAGICSIKFMMNLKRKSHKILHLLNCNRFFNIFQITYIVQHTMYVVQYDISLFRLFCLYKTHNLTYLEHNYPGFSQDNYVILIMNSYK